MKKKTLNKILKAEKKITEAVNLLSDADDELFYSYDERMITQNMSINDTVTYLFKTAKELKDSITATINVLKE